MEGALVTSVLPVVWECERPPGTIPDTSVRKLSDKCQSHRPLMYG